jgi:phosphoglucosamine mutase
VGGEQSGHIVLSDFSTTGDGLLAALQVLAEVKRQGRPVSEVCNLFTPLPQVLKNVKVGKRSTLATEIINDQQTVVGLHLERGLIVF